MDFEAVASFLISRVNMCLKLCNKLAFCIIKIAQLKYG